MDSTDNYEEEIAKLKASAPSPEEMARKFQEAQRAAQETLDKNVFTERYVITRDIESCERSRHLP